MKEPVTAMHLIVDGYSSDIRFLKDEKLIYGILDQYPAEIDLLKIAPPSVRTYVGSKPENWGVSGVVLIAESHIGIHTWVERGFVNIDVFSCKTFDALRIVRDLKARLGLTKFRFRLLERSSGNIALLDEGDEAALERRL